ncbi:MAG: fibronectin type III domain-containing protein, partial [Flavobacteriales bacterium]
TSYITGLFNQSATLFANDGIDVTLSEVFVWDVESPYTQTSSNGRLNQFGVTRTSFNGDMTHLIDLGTYGGVAWLNTLCNGQTRYRMAYSGIYSTYLSVPTYSWSVEVVTHEQGHSLGSQHTHACAWNGNNTAIDGCGPTYGAQYAEGSCATGPVPTSTVGGTIMSYCHLLSAGIKFVNGFGPQPASRIVSAVNGASCLTACGNSCDAPGSLVATGVSSTAATLTWAAIGATTYTLQWKPTSSGTWTTVTGISGNTYPLAGLTPVTSYDFRVMSVCGATSSGYSTTYSFSTPTPCPDMLEPNNSIATAAPIVLPLTLNALVATSSDVDYYTFMTIATTDISIYLSGLVGDYELVLRNGSGSQLISSTNGGTSPESINYPNAAAGTYIIQIYGYAGAFSGDQCYTLYANANSGSCPVPSDLSADAITHDGATLQWGSAGGQGEYSVQYRLAPNGNWTTVSPVVQSSYVITGLQSSTTYNFRIAKICPGSQLTYSGIGNFVTLSLPCELAPTAVVALKVLLDGPYNSTTQLMNDGLRVNGLIPTTEPYTVMGYSPLGALTTTTNVLATTGANAIIDWVLVELRGISSPYAIVETRAGLLQSDGDVVAVDGTSALGFCVDPENYRVAVRHRNHLACMTNTSYALSSNATSIDLTTSSTITYGTNARKVAGNKMLLWAGNTEPDEAILYTGQNNDRDLILGAIGGITPTNSISGYSITDVNMDGVVLYTGQNNDRDIILTNIGGVVPTASVLEQMP